MRKTQSLSKGAFPAPDVVTKVVPSPTEGWDAISPLALMDPKRAPTLDNWVARTGYVELRPGYVFYCQRIDRNADQGPVESLMVLRTPSQQYMLAATEGSVYDVSTSFSGILLGSNFLSNRWQYTNFTPAGGATVIQMVNGRDTMKQWDGTSFTTPSISSLPSGKTTADFINIFAQKRRLWYVLKNSSVAVFMPTDAITGAAAGSLDLGSIFTRGGYLVATTEWTLDGGSGPQSYLVFISSRGQVAIYVGSDPTDATNFSLNGVFNLAPPLGYRCMTQVGSDVALITLQGVLPLSQALPFDPSADRSVAITARIQNAMQQSAMQHQNNFGWEIIGYPSQAVAVLNVPVSENQTQYQYVMNVLTGAWSRFIGWNANTFALYNDILYFGNNEGGICQAFTSGTDFNQPVSANLQCAFNYFDDPGRLKRMTTIQPLLVASGTLVPPPTLSVDEDFNISTISAPVSLLVGGALWDVAIWDQDVWPTDIVTLTSWYSAQAIGHALAVHMRVNITNNSTVHLGLFDSAVFDLGTFDGNTGPAPTLQVNAFNAIMEFGGFI